jgi:Ni/Co efflux regulator RcnB
MKKVLSAALALSLLGGTAAMAQPYGHSDHRNDNNGRYSQSADRHDDRHDNRHDNRNHRWSRGERLPSSYYSSRSHYVDYRRHHLRQPPRGYQWVQVDNNYMMVALATGLISSIINQ